MKILYISVLVSPNAMSELIKRNCGFDGFAVQKFNGLVVDGLAKNGAEVKALSAFFPPRGLWHHKSEIIDSVCYTYVPSVSIPLIRRTWMMVYCFFYVLFWGMVNRNEKTLVCDVLNVSACTGAVAAARILSLKRVGIMTDMPGLMVDQTRKKKKSKCWSFSKLISSKNYLDKFTHYVFLTENMNVVNSRHRPYIVMEGLVSPELKIPEKVEKTTTRTIFYAGGLHARYGIELLVEAVKKLPMKDIQLVLYGDGPFVEILKQEKDTRIQYRGLAPNEVIVEEEQHATLLINPRPTHEDFTKYSFPSKNMEYMLSGTPLLTTRLPGMPKEYYPYVFLFEEETIEGYAKKINDILNLPSEELLEKGRSARDFVLSNKANNVQSKRILKLVCS